MAKGNTALEAALARQGPEAGKTTPIRYAVTLAVAVLAILGLCSLAQGLTVARENSTLTRLREAQGKLVVLIGEAVKEEQRKLKVLLTDEELIRALTVVDEPGRLRASVRVKQLNSEIVRAEFYAPDLPELFTSDLKEFGYAKADMLAQARAAADGMAPVQVHPDESDKKRLALVQAIGKDQRVAYAYVLMPAEPLWQKVDELDIGGGRVAIFQGGRLSTNAVHELGSMTGYEIAETDNKAVPQSLFRVQIDVPRLFEIGQVLSVFDSRKVPLLLTSGVLLLIAAFALNLIWNYGFAPDAKQRKAPAWVEALRGLKSRSRAAAAAATAAEPTFADELAAAAGGDAPAPARPRRAAAAAGMEGVEVVEDMPEPAAPAASAKPVSIERSMFRAYDIRGVVGKSLTPEVARAIGQSIGSMARDLGLREVCVGRDGRESGPQLAGALITGLRQAGIDVTDVGMVPTPVLYFATYQLNTGSGVMVTGSHNPPEYNGFKIVLGGQTLAEEMIQEVFARIVEGRLTTGSGGLTQIDVKNDYIERVVGDVQVERSLKIVVDAGNGVAGEVGPKVLEGIGCEVIPLYCEVDGQFPNHHPDPSDPHNLADLINSVKQFGADLGVAFDGDGDRLGVVTAQGEIIYPDRTLMLFAADVLMRNPGAPIIYDVKCTGHLQNVILRHGGSPIMWKTGHSLIKAKMREEGAELAGEMSGHFFFKERWYGFDDGIYAAARLCEIVAADGRPPQEIFDELPKGVSTPEIKIPMEEGKHYAFVAKFRDRANFPGARVSMIDGVRADFNDGWGLVRCSNTTPSLVLRFDADTTAALDRIQAAYREQMLMVDPSLPIPF